MNRSYKFLLRPTKGQAQRMQQCLDAHRELYNSALEERIGAWRMCRMSISFVSQSAQMKDIRALLEHQRVWSARSQALTLRRLDKAFQAFFRRVKAGDAPGFPRFKAKDRWDSVTWSDRDGSRWDSGPEGAPVRVYFQAIGHIRVHQHRGINGRIRTLTLRREGKRWYIVLACDEVPTALLEPAGAAVGVDVGVTHFSTDSNGRHIQNPRHGRVASDRLAVAQRSLATKKRGSNRRRRQRLAVAGIHRKIRNQRRDFHHKVALDLVRTNDVIVVEDLKISNMNRSASGTIEEPGTNVAAKRGLNRSIMDAGWGQFVSILIDKAEEAGRVVIKVNPRHTSQTHHVCGSRGQRSGEVFFCPTCNMSEHADVNGAINILRAGLALQAARAA